jgi:hypothetical protein
LAFPEAQASLKGKRKIILREKETVSETVFV